MSKRYLIDFGERVFWTCVQAAAGVATVEIADWDYTWVPVIASLLAIVKAAAARNIGNRDSASTAPNV